MSKLVLTKQPDSDLYPGWTTILGEEYFQHEGVLYKFYNQDKESPHCNLCVLSDEDGTCTYVYNSSCKVYREVQKDNGTRCMFNPKEEE